MRGVQLRIPNKFYSYEESIFPVLILLVDILKEEPLSVSDAYKTAKAAGVSATEVIEALDCLYVFNRVIYDDERRVLTYVEGA